MRVATLFFLLVLPRVVFGGVVITEIMYDPKDTDANSGGEWVEVENTGSVAVDLTKWIFFENDTNHGISTTTTGSAEIPSGGYAVISRDTTVFKNHFTEFSGLLFKASFSLNDGEKIAMKNGKDDFVTEANSVTYTSDWGAKNDGNSLQKDSAGKWIAAAPTPGSGTSSASSGAPEVPQENIPSSSAETLVVTANNSNWPVEPQVFADAGKDKVAVVGAGVTFEGKAYGLKKEPLENARFVWNFGDGSVGEGMAVLHAYRHPGDYIVVLDIASGYFSGSDRLTVRAEPSPLKISSVTDGKVYFVELSNSSKADIDISSWWLASGDKKFEIPKNTFVMGGKRLIFGNETTGLPVAAGSVPELRYPNETLAYRYGDAAKTVLPAAKTAAVVAKTPSVDKENTQEEKDDAGLGNSNLAAAAEAGGDFNYTWLLGVLAISVTAIGGVIFVQKREKPLDEADRLAREIEIVE